MSKKWTDSMLIKALRYYEYGNAIKALEWFLKGAKAGNVGCMLNAGVLYGDGASGIIDTQKELYWYKKAWDKGDVCAASNIAIVYRQKKQFKKSASWFIKAIKAGDGDANLELAKLYIMFNCKASEVDKLLSDTIGSNCVTQDSIEQAQKLIAKRKT